MYMSTKFPRRRNNNWIPFIRNQTVLTATGAILGVQLIHNLAVQLLVGGVLIIGNSVPYRHHIATEWMMIWVKKHWSKTQEMLPWIKKTHTIANSHLTQTMRLGAAGDVSIIRMDSRTGAMWFDDHGAENRLCWIGVWLIPATSHLLLSSEAEQQSTLMQWGRLLSSIAGQSVKRLQFFTDVIVTAAAGPKETLRRLEEENPDIDPALAKRYRIVADEVGGQVYDRRTYLVVEFAKIGLSQTDALRLALDQADRTIRGMVKSARALTSEELTELISGAFNPDTTFLRLLLGLKDGERNALAPVKYNVSTTPTSLVLPYHLSRTYVITEFPQMAVADTWQLNLLGGIPPSVARYTISYIWAVTDPQMALRQAEREANKVEMETLARAAGRGNQRIMSREYAEINAARETEIDLTTGEAMLKGIATITIEAATTELLDIAETWIERQAGNSFIRIRRTDRRHDEGWATSLPLAIMPQYFESHTLSTRQAQSLYQAQIAAPLNVPGILLGRDDLSGAPFSWDPFELYAESIITSPIAIVLGNVGTGKSTFSKLLALRGTGVHGYGFFALDPKGEYQDVATALGLPYMILAPGQTRINPLDLDTASSKATMLSILASSSMDCNLTPDQAAALDKTAELLLDRATLSDAIDILREVPPELSYAMGTPTRDDAVQRLIPVVAGLQRYLGSGPLGGLFDGKTSVEVNSKGMIINLSAVFREPTLFKPVSNVVAFWLRNAISKLEQRSFLIVDEGWAVLDNLASFLQSTTKLSRAYGVSLVLTMHGLSDVLGAANVGTATAGKLQTIIDAVQSAFIFSNNPNEIELIGEAFTLTRSERRLLNLDDATGNFKGLFLAIIGGHRYLCRTVLAEADMRSTDTDQNMVAIRNRQVSLPSKASSSTKIFGTWQ